MTLLCSPMEGHPDERFGWTQEINRLAGSQGYFHSRLVVFQKIFWLFGGVPNVSEYWTITVIGLCVFSISAAPQKQQIRDLIVPIPGDLRCVLRVSFRVDANSTSTYIDHSIGSPVSVHPEVPVHCVSSESHLRGKQTRGTRQVSPAIGPAGWLPYNALSTFRS